MTPVVRWEAEAGRTVLWSLVTGRAVILDSDTAQDIGSTPPPPALAQRLTDVGILGDPAPLDRIACRHHAPLLLPDRPALWHPVPSHHGAGGHAWTELPLSPPAERLWRAVNNARTLRAAAERAHVPPKEAVAITRCWTAPTVQALQLRIRPPRPGDPSLDRLVTARRTDAPRPADRYGSEGETTLTTWHLQIPDGTRHFDDVETTVAHALGRPHPALEGLTFGARLRQVLTARAMVPSQGWTVEIGCGDGALAQSWGGTETYLRVDLSPALLRTQAQNAPRTLGVCADGTHLPLRDRCAALVLSNEVIADLRAVPVGPNSDEGEAVRAVHASLHRHRISPWPHRAWYNLGAWELLEEISRILVPGGCAYVSEFGGDTPPEEATQLDHPEVAIHFGHLETVARSVGLEVERVRLDDLLQVNLGAPQLCRRHYTGLRALAAAEGWQLDARASTPDTLALPRPVEGLRWVPQTDEGPGPLITRFWALLLRKA